MNTPLVTVITPAYNVEKFIGEAVRSVLDQSYVNIEYLLVDDGSTDETVEAARRAAAGDKRLTVLMADHAGGSAARNLGLEKAGGTYIAFLDGDDRWHPDFLKKNFEMLTSLPSDVAAVFCRPRVISESGRPYLFRWERAGGYDFDGMLAAACPPKCGSSLLLKAEVFANTGGFSVDLDSAVDLDMWLRIQSDRSTGVFWANPAYLIDQRIRAGAISRDHSKRFGALEWILATYAPLMTRLPPAAAFVRPAVFAFRSGDDETALRWSATARKAGLRYLMTDLFGLRMLLWLAIGVGGRQRTRQTSDRLRALAGRVLGGGKPIGR